MVMTHEGLADRWDELFKTKQRYPLLWPAPCGLGEFAALPEMEPGSFIMPGKANPTRIS